MLYQKIRAFNQHWKYKKKVKVRDNIRLGKFTMISQAIDLGWLVVCFDCIVLIAGLIWVTIAIGQFGGDIYVLVGLK